MPVIVLGRPIEADSNQDGEFTELFEDDVIEQNPVGLDPGLHAARLWNGVPDRVGGRADRLDARQKWLATVQYDVDLGECMPLDVLCDPLSDASDRRGAHRPWLIPPALIGELIHVTVRARKIASTVQFQHKLTKRHRAPVGALQGRDIQ
jgi:hypothetical protein